MMNTNRRQTPRLPVEGLAYVNLDPDNGGIVLNISEGGLCFRSANPVQQTAAIRFWFSRRSRRLEAAGRVPTLEEVQERVGARVIEAQSELAWTDPTRKMGGLRFTNLPAGAREEIRDWINQHAAAPAIGAKLPPPFPFARTPLPRSANRQETSAERRSLTTLAIPSSALHSPKLLNGFSSGLVVGVFVSILVGAAFFLQLHSREFGDALVHFGQRLGGRPSSQPAPSASQSASPKAQAVPPEVPSASSLPHPVSSAPVAVSRPDVLVSQPPAATSKPRGKKLEATTPAATAPRVETAAGPVVPPATSSPTASAPNLPVIAVAPKPNLSSTIVSRSEVPVREIAQPVTNVESSKEGVTELPAEKFLEIGKFSDRLRADSTTEKLSRLGFKATLVHKSLFWRKSYQILVGPYGSDLEAEAAHKSLVSSGFTPRSFERGTRAFTLRSALRVDGKPVPAGDCVISWESYVPDAIVRFESDSASINVQGKWVKRDTRYDDDAIVYTRNPDGSRTLTEVRFRSLRQALVFAKK